MKNNSTQYAAIIAVEGTEEAVITWAQHQRHVRVVAEALARFEELGGSVMYMGLDMEA